MKKLISVQEWLPFSDILKKGVIKLKDDSYIKILKIFPINYNLKSELEKEAILNSYKIFLKTCNFDIQILIQSNKEDLNPIISQINNQIKKEEDKIRKISESYIKYIKEINSTRKSTAKRFFIIIKTKNKKDEEIIGQELEEKYLKIKENLERCGNKVEEIQNETETKEILFSFYNKRMSQI